MARPASKTPLLLAALLATCAIPASGALAPAHDVARTVTATLRVEPDGAVTLLSLAGGECNVDIAPGELPIVDILCLGDIVDAPLCTATLQAYWDDIVAHGVMYGSAYCGSARNYCVNTVVIGCYATITAPARSGGCDLTAITLIGGAPVIVHCSVTYS